MEEQEVPSVGGGSTRRPAGGGRPWDAASWAVAATGREG